MNLAQATIPRYLAALQTEGGLKGADIANAVDVSKATVSRWKSGQFRPHPRPELILSDLYSAVSRSTTRRKKSAFGSMPAIRSSPANGRSI